MLEKYVIYSQSNWGKCTVCGWSTIVKTTCVSLSRTSYEGLSLNLTSDLKTSGHALHKRKGWLPNTSCQHCDLEFWKRARYIVNFTHTISPISPSESVTNLIYTSPHVREMYHLFTIPLGVINYLWLEKYS